MRALIGIIVTVGLALGIYYFYLKTLPTTGSGTVATQSISISGVKNDLVAIAQAERLYVAQNGACVGLDMLTSSGSLSATSPAASKPGRDGYTYAVDCSGVNFTITAKHASSSATSSPSAVSVHYPSFSIDQTMEIHEVN